MEVLISRLIQMGLFKYLGISAIGVLIWYTGPYIPFMRPISHRLIAIAIVLVGYGIYVLVGKLLNRRKSEKLSDDLAANAEHAVPAADQRSDEEISTLQSKFDDALEVLKKSGKKNASLYSLPWYMIIGPPGAGKTTLLVNSGLKFPLAEKMGLSKLQGVGGTRFCDWWFTDEAVIVDTAGRYTTQDSDEEVDNAAWMGFLKLLRKNRKRRPISGIIVAISIDDLLRQSEVDRERTASAVAQRIQELYEQLGVSFPIYVKFTKCDLLSGFMEFFGDLDRHQREQVWGTTFKLNDNPIEMVDDELRQLQSQLEARLVQRLQQERDPARRNLIYNFPSLFDSARPIIDEFIERVFKPNRYTKTPLLRGVYFTSGTQEGTPFNRLISQLARGFNLSHASVYGGPSRGKSFFIRDLLSKVIFGESGLAGTNVRAERIYRALRTAGIVATVLIPLVLVGLWLVSYSNNTDGMKSLDSQASSLDDKIEQVPPLNHSLLSVLPVLNESRELTFGYAASIEGRTPLNWRYGLYQGKALGNTETIPAYRNALENAFLSRLLIRIEQQLRSNLNDPALTRSALKAYLMLYFDEELNAEYVKSWVINDWRRNFGDSAYREYQAELEGHLEALFDLRPFTLPYEQDRNLVEHALAVLEQTSKSERIYAGVKTELRDLDGEFSLSSHGGSKAPLALKRKSGKRYTEGVPFMFSRDGYYKHFIPSLFKVIAAEEDEGWLKAAIGQDTEAIGDAELRSQVADLYFDEYITTWWDFLEDIRIRPFENAEDAANILQIISADDSPLVLILRGAAERTTLEMDLPAGEGVVEAASQIQTVGDPSRVDLEFRSLHDFVNGRGGQPSHLDGVKDDIRELTIYMSRVARQGIDYASSRDKQDIAHNADVIRLSAGNAPEPMDQWIIDLADQTNSLVAGSQKRNLNAAWRSDVDRFCQEAIAGRFPFSRNSDRDVSISEFAQFFGPSGIMDQFYGSYMADLVEQGNSRWRIRPNLARTIPVNQAALDQMRLAKEIQKAFFPPGASMPIAEFSLTPERIDKDSELFSMQLLGKRLHYQHDVQAPTRLVWPGVDTSFGQIQMQFKPLDPNRGPEFATFSGDWAWFRLLDESNPRPGDIPEEVRITFSLGEHFINYLLRAERTHNPFNLQLSAFQCVPNL